MFIISQLLHFFSHMGQITLNDWARLELGKSLTDPQIWDCFDDYNTRARQLLQRDFDNAPAILAICPRGNTPLDEVPEALKTALLERYKG